MISLEGLTGRVVTMDTPGYEEARQNYNGRFDKYPLVIVFCESARDVANAILWVRKQQLPFRIRCGRHSYEAYSLVDGGLVIDVSRLQKLIFDKPKGTVQIGVGFRLQPLYETLWNQGVTIPIGTCPTVGISGLTLGGGYGLLSRQLGMSCDSLLEVEMVTARGELIRANHWRHPDLFWACLGGGDGSFGVITSLTFRVYPIGNVARYMMSWDFADLKKVVRYWQQWAPHADSRLTSLLLLPARNQGDIRSNGVFVGSEEELRQIMLPMQEATRPQIIEFQTNSWMEAARLFAGRPVRQALFKNSSAFAYEPLSESALDVLIHNLQTAPGFSNMVAFDAFGGWIGQVPDNATAFVHRNALFLIQYQSYWQQAEEAAGNIQWIEQFRRSMLPYTRGAYRCYCDSLISDWPEAYFGENLERLRMVKRAYDPENLFYFEQSIPL